MTTTREGRESGAEQHELLDSVSFVYKGKTKEYWQVKRGNYDHFWNGSFEVGPDFKGTLEQKRAVYQSYATVFERPNMLGIDGASSDRLYYSARIGDERTDVGAWFDEECERITRILNDKQTKDTVSLYMLFSEEKEKLRIKLGGMR